jgi:hypothetical protein
MKKIEVLGINDRRWIEIVSASNMYDFYHTAAYSMIATSDETVLFVAFWGNDFIALPLVIRSIEGTTYYDITSVYGYCGPISNLKIELLTDDHIYYFQEELWHFFSRKQVISAFVRLHPLLNQARLFENFGLIKEINKTVAIDLNLSEEQQLKNYRESHSRRIRKLIKTGYSVVEATTEEEIDCFINIYVDSMKRFNTNKYYFFSKYYFHQLLENSEFNSKLLLAKKNNTITAGGIFTFTNRIMQYHLGATKSEYSSESPMKIIIDQARRMGNNLKMEFLHLGGGFGGKSDDSLYYFKSGFSDTRFQYSTWQLIIDKDVYSKLANKFNIELSSQNDFFPIYRTKHI